jgi:predicted DNA-binding transcriptional regulator AlpA
MGPNMHKLALSVDDFCHAHSMCRASFYNLMKRGRGPRIMKVGGRTLVSHEAAEEWRRQMEVEPTAKRLPTE